MATNAVRNFDLSRAIEVLEELRRMGEGDATTKSQKPLPPDLRDGQYRSWEIEMAQRFPLALSEMRVAVCASAYGPNVPACAVGIDINAGWRAIMERLLVRLEAMIAAQPVDERDRFRILQVKEKFGRADGVLGGRQARDGMWRYRRRRKNRSGPEVCGAPGVLEERHAWWSTRCKGHETWRPWDKVVYISFFVRTYF